MVIRSILRLCSIFCGQWVCFMIIWYRYLHMFSHFGILYHEKSGNPVPVGSKNNHTQRGCLILCFLTQSYFEKWSNCPTWPELTWTT
jgi:hypothetical protein